MKFGEDLRHHVQLGALLADLVRGKALQQLAHVDGLCGVDGAEREREREMCVC